MQIWIKIVAGALSTLIVTALISVYSTLGSHSIDIATLKTDYAHLKEGQVRIERKQDKILDKLDEMSK
jgi:hypothetical protein